MILTITLPKQRIQLMQYAMRCPVAHSSSLRLPARPIQLDAGRCQPRCRSTSAIATHINSHQHCNTTQDTANTDRPANAPHSCAHPHSKGQPPRSACLSSSRPPSKRAAQAVPQPTLTSSASMQHGTECATPPLAPPRAPLPPLCRQTPPRSHPSPTTSSCAAAHSAFSLRQPCSCEASLSPSSSGGRCAAGPRTGTSAAQSSTPSCVLVSSAPTKRRRASATSSIPCVWGFTRPTLHRWRCGPATCST